MVTRGSSRERVEFASEHPDFPKWGSPEWAPMQEPTRLTLMLNAHAALTEEQPGCMLDPMSDKTKQSGLALMRAEFPDNQISKLPRGGRSLDYVGHAALTDRLLDCDPQWHWEPMALTPEGLPLFDASGGLWIRLTVCGVTRLGYGHAASKANMDPGAREKEVIGDALRNAGMRFGAALALWHKGELHAETDDVAATDTSEFSKATGEEWLKKFDAAATLAEVTQVSAEIKKIWDTLKTIPGFVETVRVRREKALARVRGYDNKSEG